MAECAARLSRCCGSYGADGLVLLTSLSFVAGVVAIARKRALAKELATVEL